MEERRKSQPGGALSPELVSKGSQQLESEIKVIEQWLKDLEETREDNPVSAAAKKSYNDMLKSRQELLNSLKNRK